MSTTTRDREDLAVWRESQYDLYFVQHLLTAMGFKSSIILESLVCSTNVHLHFNFWVSGIDCDKLRASVECDTWDWRQSQHSIDMDNHHANVIERGRGNFATSHRSGVMITWVHWAAHTQKWHTGRETYSWQRKHTHIHTHNCTYYGAEEIRKCRMCWIGCVCVCESGAKV